MVGSVDVGAAVVGSVDVGAAVVVTAVEDGATELDEVCEPQAGESGVAEPACATSWLPAVGATVAVGVAATAGLVAVEETAWATGAALVVAVGASVVTAAVVPALPDDGADEVVAVLGSALTAVLTDCGAALVVATAGVEARSEAGVVAVDVAVAVAVAVSTEVVTESLGVGTLVGVGPAVASELSPSVRVSVTSTNGSVPAARPSQPYVVRAATGIAARPSATVAVDAEPTDAPWSDAADAAPDDWARITNEIPKTDSSVAAVHRSGRLAGTSHLTLRPGQKLTLK